MTFFFFFGGSLVRAVKGQERLTELQKQEQPTTNAEQGDALLPLKESDAKY